DEPRRWCRQIRRAVVEGPERREVGPQAVPEQLVEAQRAREILEAMDAEGAQLDALVQQRAGGLGEENLPAGAGVRPPGRVGDVEPSVAASRRGGLTRVQADSHANLFPAWPLVLGERALRLARRGRGVVRGGKNGEGRVAFAAGVETVVAVEG